MQFRSSVKELDTLVIPVLMGVTLLLGVFYACSNAVYDGVQWKFHYRLFETGFGYGLFLDMLLSWVMVTMSIILLLVYTTFLLSYLILTRFGGNKDMVVTLTDKGIVVKSVYLPEADRCSYADIESASVHSNGRGSNLVRIKRDTDGVTSGEMSFLISDKGLEKLRTESEVFNITPTVSRITYTIKGYAVVKCLSKNLATTVGEVIKEWD